MDFKLMLYQTMLLIPCRIIRIVKEVVSPERGRGSTRVHIDLGSQRWILVKTIV
jgi:hypothetical protein